MSTPQSRKAVGIQHQPPPSPVNKESPTMNLKSEYLKSALHDRRLRAGTPAGNNEPIEVSNNISTPPPSSVSTSDPWIEAAQSDSESDHSPIRRRQPSGGPHLTRKQTQRELETQQDRLKTVNFDLALKLRLVEEQNAKLKDELEAATKRIEDLEPMEEKMVELREDNDQLKLQLQSLDEDFLAMEKKHFSLKARFNDLKSKNEECLAINQDLITEMEKRDAGLNEAADLILQLEEENMRLKTQLNNCPIADHGSLRFGTDAAADTPPTQPTRVYSIDELRPTTSNIDSDYYSQPASPQVRANQELHPTHSAGPYTERVRGIVDKSLESRKSVNRLKKRMSQVSLTSEAAERAESPISNVPHILESVLMAEQVRQTGSPRQKTSRIPKVSQIKKAPSTPRSTITATGGLRDLYQSGASVGKRGPPPKLDFKTRAAANGKVLPNGFSSEPSPLTPPSQTSSKCDLGSTSDEHIDPEGVPPRSVRTPVQAESSFLAPSDTATVDGDDLTTEPDPQNKWWKDLAKLQGERLPYASPSQPPRGIIDSPGPVLFNAAEDEDAFMARAKHHFFRH